MDEGRRGDSMPMFRLDVRPQVREGSESVSLSPSRLGYSLWGADDARLGAMLKPKGANSPALPTNWNGWSFTGKE